MIETQTLGGRNILMVMVTLGPAKMTTEHAQPLLQKFSRPQQVVGQRLLSFPGVRQRLVATGMRVRVRVKLEDP